MTIPQPIQTSIDAIADENGYGLEIRTAMRRAAELVSDAYQLEIGRLREAVQIFNDLVECDIVRVRPSDKDAFIATMQKINGIANNLEAGDE